jgi:glycosyltransferase involved in cell wall biosynthesis
MSDPVRILFLCHSHPDLQAGGTEIFSLDLFRELRSRDRVTGVYLAGTSARQRSIAPGTPFQAVGTASDELLLWTAGFDSFYLSQTDLHGVIPEFASLLRKLRPDVVHVHHTLQLGLELVTLIKRVLPSTQIVMTLHDYYAICANDGQMQTTAGLPCSMASIDACHRCFPDRPATDFRLRDVHIRGALRAVDRFVSPSDFLRDRFIAWGIAPDQIELIRNGLPSLPRASARECPDGRRDRFGFFGHINRFKGATIALEASARLTRSGVAHQLSLHGSSAYQAQETLDQFGRLLDAAPDAVHRGAYVRHEQAKLIADVDWVIVPSVWWENAPLIIQEAFAHGRPVICSNVGGMAEAVRGNIDGLHFNRGDARSLAQTMQRAIEQPGLWQRLVEGIRQTRTIQEAADEHLALYRSLISTANTPRWRAA